MNLHQFSDIHTHRLDAPEGSIINLPLGMDVPDYGYYSVGIHPWYADKATEADFRHLRLLANHPRVVAIGEAGLDRLCDVPMAIQHDCFVKQVKLSEEVGKPLIIHAVRTLSEILYLRKSLRPSQPWIIHGFRGKPELALQLISHGIDISIGEKHHPDIFNAIPLEHIYRETDHQ